MATPGTKPKPTRLKVLAGNPGKRPLNDREPQPPRYKRLPSPPEHLGEAAVGEWKRVGRLLNRIGVLTRVDMAALEGYCVAYGRWVEAELKVKELGAIVTTSNKNLIQNPYLAVANRAMKEMRTWMAEFGITPSSRSRVELPMAEPEDELAKLLSRRSRMKVVNE